MASVGIIVRAERDGEPDGEEEVACFTARAFTANFRAATTIERGRP
jgi:hypothetical protein